jgi:hypothetical protein
MAQLSIHVVHLATDDWLVRENAGREFGHYATQQEAQDVGRQLARKRKAVLLVNGRSDGSAEGASRGWFARLFGR